MLDKFVGQILGERYEIKASIGQGGMGTVWQAQDRLLNRAVAVKIIRPEYAWAPDAVEAFITEAHIIAQLDHPHILSIYDLGVQNINNEDLVYTVTKFASGGTLADRLKSTDHLSLSEVEPILEQICRALDYAHSKGIIHLDLKPANILFDEYNNVLLADFGLAKLLQTSTQTKADTGVGTRAYMSPEQAFGGSVGPSSDVYALAITLYQMLTGDLPERKLAGETLVVYLKKPLPPGVSSVIEKATMPDPSRRYRSAGEMAQAFAAVLHPTLTHAVSPGAISASTLVPTEVPLSSPQSLPLKELLDTDKANLRDALRELGQFCESNPDINEREVVTYAFKHAGFFSLLGYGEPGRDVLLEHKQADVVLRAFNGRPLAVIEFKRPNVSPNEGLHQLEHRYIARLLPDVGALCNGRELWIYRRAGTGLYHPPVLRLRLKDATDADARIVYEWLGRRELNLSSLDEFRSTLRTLSENPIPILGPTDAGAQAFLDRLSLRPVTPFGRLVAAMVAALPGMLQTSSFTRGAYAFWRRIYARDLKLKDAPAAWQALMSSNDRNGEALYHLMFTLESAYAVLSRLLLARAMENHGFPHLELTDTLIAILRRFRKHGRLAPEAYAGALKDLFDYTGQQAFQALFASDIFDWWHDISKSPGAAPVGERLAEATLAIFEFDFKPMSGDLLGGLYQSYFDPETRKALGEFYTPPEVVDFILDQVGYVADDPLLPTTRLLDPSCGSGTFLVHALQRYLAAVRGKSPVEVIQELLGGLKIVGFDVNPFAVLMAQANYAAQIIPLYAQALKQTDLPATLSIPVLRTDSLRQEYREGEQVEIRHGEQYVIPFSVGQEEDVTVIRAELPVEVEPGKFFRTEIPVPRYDKARAKGWVGSAEEYFAVLRILFDAVASENSYVSDLRQRLAVTGLRYTQELAEYMQPAVTSLIDEMERLRNSYDDGRFLKTLADLALALVLKSDVQYHYVVGNPPYIRIQTIPQALRGWWEAWYEWASGNFDAYIPFLERSIHLASRSNGLNLREWLRSGGKLGFISSDRFLLANYAKGLRAELPHKAAVELLVDFRVSTVFEDAQNSPAILIVRRLAEDEVPDDFATVRFTTKMDEKGVRKVLPTIIKAIQQIRHGTNYLTLTDFDAFLTSPTYLRSEGWLLMPPSERRAFEKLVAAATVTEAEICPVCKDLSRKSQIPHPHTLRLQDLTLTQSGAFQGIATGDDSSLIFRLLEDRGETLLLRPKGADAIDWDGPTEVEIEREVLRPWLFGRDVERWHIDWDGWYVLFPYAVIEALEKRGEAWVSVYRYRLIPLNETIEMEVYPKSWTVLSCDICDPQG